MRQSKTLILSTNVDQKSFETGFSIAICRPIFRLPCVARLTTNGNQNFCKNRMFNYIFMQSFAVRL